jgi:hypothetical protein
MKNKIIRGDFMASIDEQILRATKEIVVKFIEGGRISPTGFHIEGGRISPTGFHEAFKGIYNTVAETVKGPAEVSGKESPEE